MKKLIFTGLLLLNLISTASANTVFYSPVIGIDSAQKGIKLYPERAVEKMEKSCNSLDGEIVRYQCSTESKERFSTVACSGICKIQSENEADILIQ